MPYFHAIRTGHVQFPASTSRPPHGDRTPVASLKLNLRADPNPALDLLGDCHELLFVSR